MLRALRHTLCACPEPAGSEELTARVIEGFLSAYEPDAFYTGLGGHGIAAVFRGVEPGGPTVLCRAELDALPVEEHRAPNPTVYSNTAHLCGHDGHMAILAGLAPLLRASPPRRGRVVLLFQPAEETGAGALRVLGDPSFARFEPDHALALHNLPGEPLGTIVVRPGMFACGSVGMRVELDGQSAHAAEPHEGRSPARLLVALIKEMLALDDAERARAGTVTITHVRMGRASFGVSPGRAVLQATLRAESDVALDALRAAAEGQAKRLAREGDIPCRISWHEAFPATENAPGLVSVLRQVCADTGTVVQEASTPFRWSDDFGHFASRCPSLYFGLGAGVDQTGLHQPDYSFPDDALARGVQVMYRLATALTDHAA